MVMLIEFEADEVVSTSMQSREYVKTILTYRSLPLPQLGKVDVDLLRNLLRIGQLSFERGR